MVAQSGFFSVLLQCINYWAYLCIFYDFMYAFITLFRISMLCANVLLGHLSMLVPCCAARISILSVRVFTLLQGNK